MMGTLEGRYRGEDGVRRSRENGRRKDLLWLPRGESPTVTKECLESRCSDQMGEITLITVSSPYQIRLMKGGMRRRKRRRRGLRRIKRLVGWMAQ